MRTCYPLLSDYYARREEEHNEAFPQDGQELLWNVEHGR